MIKRKLTGGLIVLALSAVMLAGCGGNTAGRSSAPDQAAAGSSQTAESTVTEAPAAEGSKAVESTAEAGVSDAAGAGKDAQATAGQITLGEALKAALEDAGLTDADVVVRHADLDTDGDAQKYEVEFYANDTEYDYDIDAMTAAVLSVEKDAMDAEDYTEMETLRNRAAEVTGTKEVIQGAVTQDEALEIALKDAGVAAGDVTTSSVEQDYDEDRDKMVYDVEIHVGNVEYNYEIDVETGAVYESETDTDD